MKLSVSRFAVLFCTLAVVLVSAFASVASAADAILAVKQVQWLEPGASTATDTTFITDENDSVRTVPISTQDWDWDAILHNTYSAGAGPVRVFFVATGGANNGVTDTLFYRPEYSVGGVTQLVSGNGVITGAVGNSAVCPTGSASIGNGNVIFTGTLLFDPDTFASNNVWLAPEFQLKVSGDISGSTPKVSGVKCYVVYPQRAASK